MENENGSMGEPGGDAGQSNGDNTGGGFAGFETPEALAEAYQGLVTEKTSLSEKLSNLEKLRGQHGTEIGNLRQQIATLTGQINAYKTMPPAPVHAGPPMPTLDDIALKLSNGDISEADAIKQAAMIASQATETKLGEKFKTMLSSEIGKLKSESAREKYVSNFIKENPGYEEAYKEGKLYPWLSKGMGGEEAWLHYQLQATKSELDGLKAQSKKAAEEAEKKGMEKGVKIEQGKTGAAKVLNGKSTSFAQHQGNYDLNDATQRRQAAIDHLNRLRSGT